MVDERDTYRSPGYRWVRLPFLSLDLTGAVGGRITRPCDTNSRQAVPPCPKECPDFGVFQITDSVFSLSTALAAKLNCVDA